MGTQASWMLAVSASLVLRAPTLAAQVVEVEEITAPDPDLVFDFGGSLSLSGQRVAVGAPSHNSENNYPGAVYVFERQKSGGWLQTAFIQPVDGGGADAFGGPLALSGDRLLASATWPGSDCEDCTLPPPVTYLFERDAFGAWSEAARFTSSPAGSIAGALALADDLALIGGRLDDGSEGVRVLERAPSGTWALTGGLRPSDPTPNQTFGWRLSLSGARVLVGASESGTLGAYAGTAYLFERDANGSWLEVAQLFAADGTLWDLFGSSVALDGERALVGARGLRERYGAAYVFERQANGTWQQVAKLTAGDPRLQQGFGANVSLRGDRALVRAAGDPVGGTNAGAVYVFERQASGAWLQTAKLKASDASANDFFGAALLQVGNEVLVGAIGAGSGPQDHGGSVYTFDLRPLDSAVGQVSVSAGGAQPLELDAGHQHALETYHVLGSISGTTPGLPHGPGHVVPLNPDAYFLRTLRHPGLPPIARSTGVLDARGHATAAFRLPPSGSIHLIGLTVHHAFLTFRPGLHGRPSLAFVSNALPVSLVP